MWWNLSNKPGFVSLLPRQVVEALAAATAIVEVGGLTATGPQRGRDFEQLFYKVCDRRGVHLTERAGARSIATQRSASGFAHEIDAASRGAAATTCWELKHLSGPLEKNELLIFNSKTLDYLIDARSLFASTPLFRFLLCGGNIRDECRVFAAQWGITVIEPGRLAVPLIYEMVARGISSAVTDADEDAVRLLAPWACRPLQSVLRDLSGRCDGAIESTQYSNARRAKEVMDLQEQIGRDVGDEADERFPDWINTEAAALWDEVGGWS